MYILNIYIITNNNKIKKIITFFFLKKYLFIWFTYNMEKQYLIL